MLQIQCLAVRCLLLLIPKLMVRSHADTAGCGAKSACPALQKLQALLQDSLLYLASIQQIRQAPAAALQHFTAADEGANKGQRDRPGMGQG